MGLHPYQFAPSDNQRPDVAFSGVLMNSKNINNNFNKPPANGVSLNGHAYVSDPFSAYKPQDPSEVNTLDAKVRTLSKIKIKNQPPLCHVLIF